MILTDFLSFRVNEEKLENWSIFEISFKVWVCDQCENLIMIKTSQFFSIYQEGTFKSSLHLNLISLTDFHSFTVNEDNLSKLVNLKISA